MVVKEKEIRFVVIDSVGAAAEGDTESAKVICALFQELRTIKVATLLIDHQSKIKKGESYADKSVYGSIYKSNLSRSNYQLETVDNQENEVRSILRHRKCNFTALADPVGLSMSFGNDFIVASDEQALELIKENKDSSSVSFQVTEALITLGEATAKEIAVKAGLNPQTVRNYISDQKGGDLIGTGQKKGNAPIYRLTEPSYYNIPLGQDYYDGQDVDSKTPVQLIKDNFNAEIVQKGAPF